MLWNAEAQASQDLYIAVLYMIFAFSIHSLILHVCLFVLLKNVYFILLE